MKSKHPESLNPAFPVQTVTGLPNGNIIYGFNGITIRDYFATSALQSIALKLGDRLTYTSSPTTRYEVAKICYDLADAMIAERSKYET